MMLKFDMHCHTKEGSVDASVGIEEYIKILKKKGFHGMLITDHNSYDGFFAWEKLKDKPGIKGFRVLCGIEYDTLDAGHILIILPDGLTSPLLTVRGMKLKKLECVVHEMGGILGPAHPFDTGFFAMMNNPWIRRHKEFMDKFDFIETLNSCTTKEGNVLAARLARRFHKPGLGGSDSHFKSVVGTACTLFFTNIKSNNELIEFIKDNGKTYEGGQKEFFKDDKNHLILRGLGVMAYWVYNKLGAALFAYKRSCKMKVYCKKYGCGCAEDKRCKLNT